MTRAENNAIRFLLHVVEMYHLEQLDSLEQQWYHDICRELDDES